jgi:hypothetical protein
VIAHAREPKNLKGNGTAAAALPGRQGGTLEKNAMDGDRGMSIAPTASPLLQKQQPTDLRLIFLTSLGGAMEFYDFTLFAFFSTTLAKAFIPPVAPTWLGTYEALGVFAAAYLARPLGGLVLAYLRFFDRPDDLRDLLRRLHADL